jgi:glyoxylase-like metal-dependent hydrolase (beta-lactamase superfamily II)
MMKISLFYIIVLIISQTVLAQSVHVTQVSDDVIVLHPSAVDDINEIRKVGGNVTCVRTDRGLVVFDSFISTSAAEIGRDVIHKYYPNIPIKYLVNTHHHPDHVSGNSYFQEACIIAHMNLNKNTDTPVNIQIQSDAVLTFGGKTFEILYFGNAHTENDLIILDREDRLLIMGDLLCRRKCYVLAAGSDALNWIALLEKITERKEEYDFVIPGHCGVVEDVASLIEQRNYLSDVWSVVKKARESDLTLEETKKSIHLEKYKDYMMYDRIGLDLEACWNQMK